MAARTLPTMPSWSTGQEITSTLLNQITAYAQFWANPPEFKMHQGVAQTLTTSTTATLTLDTSDWDSDSGRSGTTPFGYIVPFAGRWHFTWGCAFTGNGTGVRVAYLQQNGSTVPSGGSGGFIQTSVAGTCIAQGSTRVVCNVGDVITVAAQQTSGGNLATIVGGPASWLDGRLESLASP